MCKYWVKPAKSRIHFRSKSLASEVVWSNLKFFQQNSSKLRPNIPWITSIYGNLTREFMVVPSTGNGCCAMLRQLLAMLRLRPGPPGRSTRTSKRPALSPGHRNPWASEIGGLMVHGNRINNMKHPQKPLCWGELQAFWNLFEWRSLFFRNHGHKKWGLPHFWTESSGWELLTILGQVGAIRCVPIL